MTEAQISSFARIALFLFFFPGNYGRGTLRKVLYDLLCVSDFHLIEHVGCGIEDLIGVDCIVMGIVILLIKD